MCNRLYKTKPVSPVSVPAWLFTASPVAEPITPAVAEPEAAEPEAVAAITADADHQFIVAAGADADAIWDAAEPPGDPCPKCGSLERWWDLLGNEHCQQCQPLHRARALADLAARIRRRKP